MIGIPKISVIIPVYKGELYLEECVQSIQNQTLKDIEILLLDDGSPDKSGEICDRMAIDDERIRVIHKANEGINATRCRGVKEAKAEWIVFSDDDDTMPADALEAFWNEHEETDIVIGFLENPVHRKPLNLSECRENAISARLFPPTPWGKLYRKSLFDDAIFNFPREIDGEEDTIMNIRLMFKTQVAPHFVFRKVYNFRRNTASVSHQKKASLAHEALFDKVRAASIPSEEFGNYMDPILHSCLNGLTRVGYYAPEELAIKGNPYLLLIEERIKDSGYRLNLREWWLLRIKSKVFLKGFAFLVMVYNFTRYHLGLNN